MKHKQHWKNKSNRNRNRRKQQLDDPTGRPIMVELGPGISIEQALRDLKQQMKDAKIFLTLYENSYYTKPSEKRRKKKHLGQLREKYRREAYERNNPTRH